MREKPKKNKIKCMQIVWTKPCLIVWCFVYKVFKPTRSGFYLCNEPSSGPSNHIRWASLPEILSVCQHEKSVLKLTWVIFTVYENSVVKQIKTLAIITRSQINMLFQYHVKNHYNVGQRLFTRNTFKNKPFVLVWSIACKFNQLLV